MRLPAQPTEDDVLRLGRWDPLHGAGIYCGWVVQVEAADGRTVSRQLVVDAEEAKRSGAARGAEPHGAKRRLARKVATALIERAGLRAPTRACHKAGEHGEDCDGGATCEECGRCLGHATGRCRCCE